MSIIKKFRQNVMHTVILGLALFSVQDASARSVVCRESGVAGFDASASRAHHFVPHSYVRDMSKAKVYVEVVGDEIYYHSNYMSDGAENPTKVVMALTQNGANDPGYIYVNIVHIEPPSGDVWESTIEVARNDVEFVLDKSVFDKNGIPLIDLTGFKKISIANGSTGKILSRNIELLTTQKPPPSAISKIAGCCLYGRPPHLSAWLSQTLRARKFDPSEAKIASLVIDNATESAFAQSSVANKARYSQDAKAIKSTEDIKRMFEDSRGKTLFLLGHVEGTDYVIRSPSNQVQFRMSVVEIRALARTYDILLVDIGCKTTEAVAEESMGFGVMTKYNTVEAVRSIDRALKSAKNLEEVLTSVSSPDLRIVIDQTLVRNKIARGSVYGRLKGKLDAVWIRLASFTISDNRGR